jgi:transposase
LRRGWKCDITPALLEKVAGIYRANVHGAPIRAVEHHFQISQRMGVEYVSRARKAGLLPATVNGRKQA